MVLSHSFTKVGPFPAMLELRLSPLSSWKMRFSKLRNQMGHTSSYIYPAIVAGAVKFNVLMSQWNWCENDCKSSKGVGDSVRMTITMTNQITANSSASAGSGCTNGCWNGAVEDLGGVFLGVLNTYSIKTSDGTVTQYTLPKNPELTVDPPSGSLGSARTTTLVLQFPSDPGEGLRFCRAGACSDLLWIRILISGFVSSFNMFQVSTIHNLHVNIAHELKAPFSGSALVGRRSCGVTRAPLVANYSTIWGVPEMGVPLFIIHFERWDFPQPSSLMGVPRRCIQDLALLSKSPRSPRLSVCSSNSVPGHRGHFWCGACLFYFYLLLHITRDIGIGGIGGYYFYCYAYILSLSLSQLSIDVCWSHQGSLWSLRVWNSLLAMWHLGFPAFWWFGGCICNALQIFATTLWLFGT